MKPYQNFILMSDLDGTLANSNHEISQRNKDAIAYFVAQGGHFAIATGRTQKNLAPFMTGITVNAPCILYNGGALFSWQEQRFLKIRHMEGAETAGFVQACKQLFPAMCIEIFTEEQLYIVTDPANIDEHMIREKQEFAYAGLDDILDKAWIKLILCDSHENLMAGRELLPQFQLTEKTNNFFSADTYLELVGKQVSKGSMLAELRELAPYRGKKVVAAGDFQNDIEMLRLADCGIAPENAQADVKKAADIVAVSNDDDLLHDIVQRILPKLVNTDEFRIKGYAKTDRNLSFS